VDTTDWLTDVEARAALRVERPRSPQRLTVLFDPGCALCQRCRAWMLAQTRYVALDFVACTGDEARARYGDLPWLGDELVVVGDGGEVWVGPAAFLTCLWALCEWREWSYRLAGPAFAPLAERFFLTLSSRRRSLAKLFEPRCEDGTCRIGPSPRRAR
jgi:predicted DCC family thiol-disulfide oxidoreductase YuxK